MAGARELSLPMLMRVFLYLFGALIAVVAYWRLVLIQIVVMVQLVGRTLEFAEAFEDVRRKQGRIFQCFLIAFGVMIAVVLVIIIVCVAALFLYNYNALPQFGHAAGGNPNVIGFFFGVVVFLAAFWIFTAIGNLFSLSIVMAAFEDKQLSALWAEAASYVRRDFWRLFWFSVVVTICVVMLPLPSCLPTMAAAFVDIARHQVGDATHPPRLSFQVMVLSEAWGSLVGMFYGPIFYLSCGLLYQDLKMRLCGSDIAERLKRLEVAAADG
jgi:hypothetical protein